MKTPIPETAVKMESPETELNSTVLEIVGEFSKSKSFSIENLYEGRQEFLLKWFLLSIFAERSILLNLMTDENSQINAQIGWPTYFIITTSKGNEIADQKYMITWAVRRYFSNKSKESFKDFQQKCKSYFEENLKSDFYNNL